MKYPPSPLPRPPLHSPQSHQSREPTSLSVPLKNHSAHSLLLIGCDLCGCLTATGIALGLDVRGALQVDGTQPLWHLLPASCTVMHGGSSCCCCTLGLLQLRARATLCWHARGTKAQRTNAMRDGAGPDGDRTSALNVDQKRFNLRKSSREDHLPAFTRQAVIHPVMSFKGNV